jgi:hypothetical protein
VIAPSRPVPPSVLIIDILIPPPPSLSPFPAAHVHVALVEQDQQRGGQLRVTDSPVLRVPDRVPPYELLALDLFLDPKDKRLERLPPTGSKLGVKARVVITRVLPFRRDDVVGRRWLEPGEKIDGGLFDWGRDAPFLFELDMAATSGGCNEPQSCSSNVSPSLPRPIPCTSRPPKQPPLSRLPG